MKRISIILVAMALAYAAMRVWPTRSAPGVAPLCASLVVLLAFLFSMGPRELLKASFQARAILAALVVAAGSFLALFFLHAPAVLDEAAEQIITVFSTDAKRQRKAVEQQVNQRKTRSGNWLWNEQTIRPLPRRARLKPGNQPEVFLQLDDPTQAPALIARRAYVSAFALGAYDQASWSLIAADTTSPPEFPLRPGTLLEYEIFHPSDPSGQTPVVALQGMRDVSISPLSYRGDGILILPPSEAVIGYRYRARSQPLQVDDLDDLVTAAPRTAVSSALLALPGDEILRTGIRGLTAKLSGAGSLKQQLVQLRAGIQKECEYSLDIENPQNLDPLQNFLFHEKRGHCELFATAGALAARALGVPSRIAYGWTGGSYYESSNLFVFRAREAHAWTEVFIADVGWVVMDCTPPASIGRSRAAPPEETPVDSASADLMSQEQELDASLSSMISLTLFCVLVIASMVGFLVWRFSARSFDHSTHDISASPAALNYYRSFLSFCRANGITVAPHKTLRKLLDQCSSLPSFASRLLKYHYGVRYGRHEADARIEAELDQQIRHEK